MCVYGGEFKRAIADGKMGCVPKKEIKESLFFIVFHSVEEDGITLGDDGATLDTAVKRRASHTV